MQCRLYQLLKGYLINFTMMITVKCGEKKLLTATVEIQVVRLDRYIFFYQNISCVNKSSSTMITHDACYGNLCSELNHVFWITL